MTYITSQTVTRIHCVDLNIDYHKPTNDVINMMFSNALIPLINKPTRITSHSATIIDNTFSNNIDNQGKILQGNITMYISDHFAQFHILETNSKNQHNDEYMLIRLTFFTTLSELGPFVYPLLAPFTKTHSKRIDIYLQ